MDGNRHSVQLRANNEPILNGVPLSLQNRGILFAMLVANEVRKEEVAVVPGAYVPGISSQPIRLQELLIDVGRELRAIAPELDLEEFTDFYFALMKRDRDVQVTLDELIRSYALDGDEQAHTASGNSASSCIVTSGLKLCHRLVGNDNRLTLSGELSAINVRRNSSQASSFYEKMNDLALRARNVDGNESFGDILDGVNGYHPSVAIPSPLHIACSALIYAVSAVCSECLAHSKMAILSDELINTTVLSADAVQTASSLVARLNDGWLLAMSHCIRLYQIRAEAEARKDRSRYTQALDEMGVEKCGQLLKFILVNESCPHLSDALEKELPEYFPELRLPDDADGDNS